MPQPLRPISFGPASNDARLGLVRLLALQWHQLVWVVPLAWQGMLPEPSQQKGPREGSGQGALAGVQARQAAAPDQRA